jgi:erythromycin esterase-like protein
MSSDARAALREEAVVLRDGPSDFDALLSAIGPARFVLLGEATHGTHEFYRLRAEITKRLVNELGFAAVAVEADWPSAFRVNRFVRGAEDIEDAQAALDHFERFPAWMWRNADVLDFVGWLRARNDEEPPERRVGFYGLDLYSLHESIAVVLQYLDRVDPAAAERARHRYECFDWVGGDAQTYGYAVTLGRAESCEDEVVTQLTELRRRGKAYLSRDGRPAREDLFEAEQNARLVANAEEYYRAMFRGNVVSWNLRDQHMSETLSELAAFLAAEGAPAKIAVWAHNSHVGDARATQMARAGEWNLGQLARERHGREVFTLGFTTDHGTVTAAHDWNAPAQRMDVRPALPESYEHVFHELELDRFYLPLARGGRATNALAAPRLERAIGVVYRPSTERQSHYFLAGIADQFDAIIHCDATRAVEPLEGLAPPAPAEELETYPSAL